MQAQLDVTTAPLAAGHTAVCCFVNDDLCSDIIEKLAEFGVKCVPHSPIYCSSNYVSQDVQSHEQLHQ